MDEGKKARLLKGNPAEDDGAVQLANGETVYVRGLSREEQLLSVRKGDVGNDGRPEMSRAAVIERRMVSMGMVDPEMTEDDVLEWQRAPGAAGDLNKVSTRITELSGMVEGADKAAYKSVRG